MMMRTCVVYVLRIADDVHVGGGGGASSSCTSVVAASGDVEERMCMGAAMGGWWWMTAVCVSHVNTVVVVCVSVCVLCVVHGLCGGSCDVR